MEVTGSILHIGATEQVSDKFRKRLLVIATDEQYPQEIPVQFSQDKCEWLDDFGDGQEVTIHVNLRGRPWQSPTGDKKWLLTLEAWKCKLATAANTPVSTARPKKEKQAEPLPIVTTPAPTEEDDLPF